MIKAMSMEAFTFATSTQVDFPIHVKMYVNKATMLMSCKLTIVAVLWKGSKNKYHFRYY